MKLLLTLIIVTLPFFASSQYTQNIDTLSRKELRLLLKNQPYSKKARDLIGLSKDLEMVSFLGYAAGTTAMIAGFSHEQRNEQDVTGVVFVFLEL